MVPSAVVWDGRRWLGALVALVALAVPGTALAATTRYASPSGSGTACTQASPCDVVTAINSAASGDDVNVPGDLGAYVVAASINSPTGVHVHGTNGRPALTMASGTFFTMNAGSTIDGMAITFSGASPGDFGLHGASGSPISADRMIVQNTGDSHACYLDYATLTNSICWVSGTTASSNSVVETDDTNTLRNDTIWATGSGGWIGLEAFGRNAGVSPVSDTLVDVIVRGGPGGSDGRADSQNGVDVTVNLSHSNWSATLVPGSGAPTLAHVDADASDQTEPPAFADPATGDFHEASSSPTIDAGINDPANGALDVYGDPRTLNGTTDIGAAEFVPPTGGGGGAGGTGSGDGAAGGATPDTSAPTVAIQSPRDGTAVLQGARLTAGYTCSDPDGAADIARCAGPVAPGAAVDTSTVGRHSFTVDAADRAGNRSSRTVSYIVVADENAPLPGCVSPRLFRSFGLQPRGGHVWIAFAARTRRVIVDVFAHTLGRRIALRPTRVARFTVRRSFTWNGRPNLPHVRVADGIYSIRVTARRRGTVDTRELTLIRVHGRFMSRVGFFRPASCDNLRLFTLGQPAFGGPTNRPLRITYALRRATTVLIRVIHNGRLVATFADGLRAAGRLWRHTISARRQPVGDYKVFISLGSPPGTLQTSLVTRRL